MKRKIHTSLFLTSTMLFAGCNQQPFPKVGGDIIPQEEKPNPVAPAYSIELNSIVSCSEGKECVTPMVGHVPNSGTPELSFESLPDGAVYDATEGTIRYTPGFEVVDVAKDPTQTVKSVIATAILHNQGDNVTTYRKQFTFEVRNTVRPVTISANNLAPRVTEGKKFSQVITLASEDFPNGPFYLNFQNQPQGLTFTADANDPHRFTLDYTPAYDVVTTSDPMDGGHFTKVFDMSVLVTTPGGQSTSQTLSWTVVDDRRSPHVSAPTEISQGPLVNFTIRAEDPNGERAPTIQVDTNVPFGKLTAEKIETNPGVPGVSLPSTVFNVHWEDIPYDKIGQAQTIAALICGPSTTYRDSVCVKSTTQVHILGNTHPVPTINRNRWPVAKTIYFRKGSPTTAELAIADAEDRRFPVNVEILPEAMKSVVKYSNGQLEIKAATEGVQQFTVRATSQFQQSAVESFTFEALPSDWSDTVILTGGTISKEITELRDLTKRGDLLSAVFQVNERNLQLRSNLIVTTSALADKDSLPFIEKAASMVKNVIIISPLGANSSALTGEFTGLGGIVANRLSDAVGAYTLAVDARSGLTPPSLPLGLKGNTTSESDRPQSFEAGSGRKCKRLFSLQKAATDTSVGVRCQRTSGGVLSVIGFEFSDLVLTNADRSVVGNWLMTLSGSDAPKLKGMQ